MVDSSKRKSLMSLGGMMVLPFVPKGVSATTGSDLLSTSTLYAISDIDADLSIVLLTGSAPTIRVTNTTEKLTILRHINAGVVRIGAKSYDLNYSLAKSAYAIGAGKTRVIPVVETSHTTSKQKLAARYRHKLLSSASLISEDEHGRTIHTSAMYFA